MTPRWPLPGAIESTDRRVRLGAWLICALFCTGVPKHAIAQDDPVRVVFLDVGQGDAALILAPEGQAALIDAGPGVDLTPALRRWGVDSLVLAVASHPHADHLGGMRQVLRSVPVRNYMDNGQPYTTATYQAVMVELRNRPEIVYLQAVPRRLQLGSVTITVLPPPTDSESNLNDNSVGLVIEYGGFSAFFSGDSERPELDHFLQVGAVPDVTLLKAPHHGSDDAVLESFLQTARPEIVVIPVGYGNDYGHPNPAALRTYGRFAEELLRTDVHGDVVVAGYRDGRYEVAVGSDLAARGRRQPPELERPEPARDRPEDAANVATARAVVLDVFADAPGNDHKNLNGEYAVLTNRAGALLDISHWVLCDAARHCFRFPPGATIGPRGRVVVFTGQGISDGMRFYMGSGAAVWNNRGDTATLTDAGGRVVATFGY